MINTIRSEFIKLGRRATVIGSVLPTVAIVLLGTAIPYLASGNATSGGPLSRVGDGTDDATAASTTSSLEVANGAFSGLVDVSKLLGAIVLVLAALAVANEYSHGTWKNLLIRQPRRLTLMGGKLVAVGLAAAALALAATLVAVPIAYLMAAGNDVSTSTWELTQVLPTAAGLVMSNLAYATIGASLAVLLRSAATAIGIGLAWALLAEQLIASLASIQNVLPGQLAGAVTGNSATMSALSAGTWIAAWIAGLSSLALTRFARSEITS